MKILVVSDTHRNFEALEKVIRKNTNADMLIHLGDGEREFEDAQSAFPQLPMVYVRGNCDFGNHKTTHVVSTGCGVNIYCCHGHTLGVNGGIGMLVANAVMNDCKIALYGHTHIHFTDISGGVHVMNPGSPSCPRGGNKPTYGVIELSVNGEIDMHIAEV